MHFTKSCTSHFTESVKMVCKLKESVEKDVIPVQSLQQDSAPGIAQKLLALQEKVNENVWFHYD